MAGVQDDEALGSKREKALGGRPLSVLKFIRCERRRATLRRVLPLFLRII